MEKIVIFCKSYKKDIYRAKRLAESIDRFNTDCIAFFMSVPSNDLNEFKEKFDHIPCNFLTDEVILKKTSQDFGNVPSSFPKCLVKNGSFTDSTEIYNPKWLSFIDTFMYPTFDVGR